MHPYGIISQHNTEWHNVTKNACTMIQFKWNLKTQNGNLNCKNLLDTKSLKIIMEIIVTKFRILVAFKMSAKGYSHERDAKAPATFDIFKYFTYYFRKRVWVGKEQWER